MSLYASKTKPADTQVYNIYIYIYMIKNIPYSCNYSMHVKPVVHVSYCLEEGMALVVAEEHFNTFKINRHWLAPSRTWTNDDLLPS